VKNSTTTLPNCHKVCTPNGRKIFQMTIKHYPLQGPPKFTQIAIFGLKQTIWHPAPGIKQMAPNWRRGLHNGIVSGRHRGDWSYGGVIPPYTVVAF
jgi:hypothetical protein